MGIFFALLEAFMVSAAVSADAFAVSFAYGNKRIKIPILSVLIISAVCAFMLGISLFAGDWLRNYIPERLTMIICFAALLP